MDKIEQMYPVMLFYVRVSIYNGVVQCRVRETRAVLRGKAYKTAEGDYVKESSLMLESVSRDDPELTRTATCVGESSVESCVQMLVDGLRKSTQDRLARTLELNRIASADEIITTWRKFMS